MIPINPGANAAPLERKGSPKRPTVLVVDDDAPVLRALGRLLRAASFEARTFARPKLLLAAELPSADGCLLLDIGLPEMDGLELHERLLGAGCRLPVILMTGRDDASTRRLLQQTKAVAVLSKPFEAARLLDAIAHALALAPTPDAPR